MPRKADRSRETALAGTPAPKELFVKAPVDISGEPVVEGERTVYMDAINYEFSVYRSLVFPSGARLPYATEAQWERYRKRLSDVEVS